MTDTTTTPTECHELIRELANLRDRLYDVIVADGLDRMHALRTGDPMPPSREDEISALRERIVAGWDRLAARRAEKAE